MLTGSVNGAHITIGKKIFLNLCSNDYLGIPAGRIATSQMQSSSRLLSGNDPSYAELEKKLARHKSQRRSLVFPTGYMANLGAIAGIIQKGDLVLSDELNHASIIDACRLAGGRTIVYRHNDMRELARKIRRAGNRKFIITEGIFSMDGDYAELAQIAEIAQKSGAATILDDAHGDFAVGRDGRGTASLLGLAKKIDVYTSSLSKGLGSFGGYVAAREDLVNLCINRSRAFIYTSALPSVLIRDASRRMNADRGKRQKRLAENTRRISGGLRGMGYDIRSNTHIIPIVIGDEKRAADFGRALMRNGIFAQPIRYPTVPRNRARIRLSVTAWLDRGQIDRTLEVFGRIGRKFGVLQSS